MNHVHYKTFLHRYIVSVDNKFQITYLLWKRGQSISTKIVMQLTEEHSLRDFRHTGSYTVILQLCVLSTFDDLNVILPCIACDSAISSTNSTSCTNELFLHFIRRKFWIKIVEVDIYLRTFFRYNFMYCDQFRAS